MKKKKCYHSNPDTHYKALTYLSRKYNIPRRSIERMLLEFFGKFGLKHFVTRYTEISIYGFGKLYFHANTITKINRIRKEIDFYNTVKKQQKYEKKGRILLKKKRAKIIL